MRTIAPRPVPRRFATPRFSRRLTRLVVLVAISLAGCGTEEHSGTIGTRQWGSYEVTVETRPWPPRPGQNEVVVMIVGDHHQPIYDALVTMRAQATSPWVQAIEDGHVGVYRRAVRFTADSQNNLQIQLQRGDERGTLDFPVTMAAQR